MNIITLFLVYLTVVNIVTFITYGVDKWQATREGWRISEATLLWLVVAGGGFGALAAVWLFRHKTKHVKFTLGIPSIMITEFVLANIVLYMITSR
ncbi:MAG: DUF1294 domain-containing protein [Prevotella sp.]|nr:DUF1294 domain-containing protein [Prevotella sp.]MBR6191801.1 DUF1294 domain-containing protein [Prevotella sp.]